MFSRIGIGEWKPWTPSKRSFILEHLCNMHRTCLRGKKFIQALQDIECNARCDIHAVTTSVFANKHCGKWFFIALACVYAFGKILSQSLTFSNPLPSRTASFRFISYFISSMPLVPGPLGDLPRSLYLPAPRFWCPTHYWEAQTLCLVARPLEAPCRHQ